VLDGLGTETPDLPGFIEMKPLGKFGGNNQGSAFLPESYQATFVKPGGKQQCEPVANLVNTHLTPVHQRTRLDSPSYPMERSFTACSRGRVKNHPAEYSICEVQPLRSSSWFNATVEAP